MSDQEERALIRAVRESGDAAALAALRAFWIRRANVSAALEDAFGRVEEANGASVRDVLGIVSGHVALAWDGTRWEVIAFERDVSPPSPSPETSRPPGRRGHRRAP